MIILKCKMCGGDIQVSDSQPYGTCDSCGSTMTLPSVSDERKANLHNRANHYRQQNEFDKALATYESILAEDPNDAEAHWGVVLSKFGIEYVEDPRTYERLPTCHRVQPESILSDLDYKAAMENSADGYTQSLYEQEAKKIAEIQKGILSISSKEEPYDVFICYKETDATGQRTVDSTLAQDIYYQLNKENLRTFFARITLEDKLGTQYEPCIFAALNSAKVMLVIGTKQEHINAVWVKNEWSRFAALAKKDREKIIIPCYRDMGAYDLPDELSMFQSQDMSKIGFVQDLVRGINKIVSVKPQVTPVSTTVNYVSDKAAQIEPLLKRAFLFLEEAEWTQANALLEQVLNSDPENARAYIGKLMSEIKVNKEENIGKRAVNLSDYSNFQRAERFADESYKIKLLEYKRIANEKFEAQQKQEAEKQFTQKKRELIDSYHKAEEARDKAYKAKNKWKLTFFISGAISIISLIIMFSEASYGSGSMLLFTIMVMPFSLIVTMVAGYYWPKFYKEYKAKEETVRNITKELQKYRINID